MGRLLLLFDKHDRGAFVSQYSAKRLPLVGIRSFIGALLLAWVGTDAVGSSPRRLRLSPQALRCIRRLTIVGGVRERLVVTRRRRWKRLCAHGAWVGLLGGPSTSPLDGMKYVVVVSAIVILAALVIHKRMFYRPKPGRSGTRAFWVSFCLYFLPAAIAFAWLVHSATQSLSVADPWGPLVGLVGVYLLSNLLLKRELTALRRK